MQVKGTSIQATRDFVKAKFPGKYEEWMKALSAESQQLYYNRVNVGEWYDLKIAYTDPLDKIVEMFYYKNAQKGGEEMGKYSAEIGLKGIYKVFLLIASPQYLMKRAARTMQTFYNSSELEVSEDNKVTTVTIKKFDGLTAALEYRIAGWISKALELCKCKNISYHMASQISKGHTSTQIQFKWDS